VAIAMIESHFALHALANHIVAHGVIFVRYLRLENYVNDLNSLIGWEYGVAPVHRLALTYLHQPDARGELLALIGPVRLSNGWIGRNNSSPRCRDTEHQSGSPVDFAHGFLPTLVR
jgi:hypothetical protein